ncbi:hypothetical protein BB561_003772 [Smittium simulii]|uniref:Enhancer of mRNA-decapping protein 3 n=1 Tax=Smittium simulii TaxID=133385 RepID=A0A2T9YJI2_9FUNG|nr:hypothetical protein BB561_003772 [Smittium simulii]
METFLGVSVKITLKPESEFSIILGTIQNLELSSQKLELVDALIVSKSNTQLKALKYEIFGSIVEEIEILSVEALAKEMKLLETATKTKKPAPHKVSEAINSSKVEKVLHHHQDPAIVSITSSLVRQPEQKSSKPPKNPSNKEAQSETNIDDPVLADNNRPTSTPNSYFKQSKLLHPRSTSSVNRTPKVKPDTWANQDVSNYNEQEFDFEANLKLFDKKKVFQEIRSKDESDPTLLLVNTNKLVKSASSTDLSHLDSTARANNLKSIPNIILDDSVISNVANSCVNTIRNHNQIKGDSTKKTLNDNQLTISPHKWFKMEYYLKTNFGFCENDYIEVAGKTAASSISKLLKSNNIKNRVLIIVNKGKNGLYGLCCARYLANMGIGVYVFLLFEESECDFAAYQKLKILKMTDVQIFGSVKQLKKIKFDIIVDAVFTPNDFHAFNELGGCNSTNVKSIAEYYDSKKLIKQISIWLNKQKLVIRFCFDYPTLAVTYAYGLKSRHHNKDNIQQIKNTHSDIERNASSASYAALINNAIEIETTDGYNSDLEEECDDKVSSNLIILSFGRPSTLLPELKTPPYSALLEYFNFNFMLADIGIPFSLWEKMEQDKTSTKVMESPFLLSDVVEIEL